MVAAVFVGTKGKNVGAKRAPQPIGTKESNMKLLLLTIVLASLIAGIGADPSFAEVVELRTGQASAAPGVCGDLDDSFHALANSSCGVQLSALPFSGEFALAQGQPFALVIDPLSPPWLTSLPCDPEARWINSHRFGCFGDPRSVLYACEFTITELNASLATVEVCWAVDDYLGDPTGPNPIGVYVNGNPLDSSFTAGFNNLQTIATTAQCVVPVQTGTNWFYVYQRDGGCTVSGLILHARIETCAPTSTQQTTWGGLKARYFRERPPMNP